MIVITATPGPNIVIVTSPPTALPPPTVVAPTSDVVVAPTQQLNPTAIPPTPLALSPVPDAPLSNPTADAPRPVVEYPLQHIIQAGENLSSVAQRYNVTVDTLLDINDLENPNILSIGQAIQLPEAPSGITPTFKILPDARIVRAPGSQDFDLASFIAQQPGYIRIATDEVATRLQDGTERIDTLNAAQIVERISLNFSVDPRLLLILLEHRGGWLSNPNVPELLQQYPFIPPEFSPGVDRAGMYKQLEWVANQINFGYYSWKYRQMAILSFPAGGRLLLASGLNAGTVALQYFFSQLNTVDRWQIDVSLDGFYRRYVQYFGDPFANVIDPIFPDVTEQPELILPFANGETWLFTGGAHGGWGWGSAWSSIDLAPPDDREDGLPFCYVSETTVNAVSSGVIARSGDGVVVLDLDGDGIEETGWVIFYLHIADQDRIPAGTQVNAGDPIGRAACSGGYSIATHLHIARKHNGEWIPADCGSCLPGNQRPSFVMGGWRVVEIPGQEYQGYLVRDGVQLQAEQGREVDFNLLSW